MNPETDNFDWEIYRALNPDVRLGNQTQYEQHFIMHGDGRPWRVMDKYPDFDHVQYRTNYADLANETDVERHWALIGARQGRCYYVREHYDYINGIDRIYWINLQRSKDRADKMTKFLANIDMPEEKIVRVNAFDGHAGLTDIMHMFHFMNKTKYKMTPGAYGCLLSHLETIRRFYESGEERALILEDDVNLEAMPYWDKPISQIIEEAPKDWQIISLKWGHPLAEPSTLYTRWSELCYFTAAYIINRAGAEKIVNACWRENVPVPVQVQPAYKIVMIKGRRVRVPQASLAPPEHLKKSVWQIMGKRHDADYIIYSSCNTYVYAYSYFLSDETSSTVDNSHLAMHHSIKQRTLQRWRNYRMKSK
jgi:GR25 family glycosyltransferase involved in LPS biosynthesis